MGLFLLPCHEGSGKTEQGQGGKLTQERETIGLGKVCVEEWRGGVGFAVSYLIEATEQC